MNKDEQGCLSCVTCGQPAQPWQGLTDGEIQNELKKMWDKGLIPSYSIVAFANAIEQALKDKNSV